MELRSDRPSGKTGPKLVVIDTKTKVMVSMVGKAVADKVGLGSEVPTTDDHFNGFKEDIENFRQSAVAGTHANWVKQDEVFQSRYGYANAEMDSWLKALNP